MEINKFSQLDLTKQYSYADYVTWKFAERVELFKGWIMKMAPSPSEIHQSSNTFLFGTLFNYFNKSKCKLYAAPFDVRLFDSKTSKKKKDEEIFTVVQPDLMVVCDLKKIDKQGIVGAPDLVIEITSPGNSKKELKYKYELYELNGVLEYWVVNPLEKNIMVYVLRTKKFELQKIYFDDDICESIIFKGLQFDVKNVFE
jgi:Uma2 family endonuclease